MSGNYPPGFNGIFPWDGPLVCDVCGGDPEGDDCICPECPVCGSAGEPGCYENHGLVRSEGQIAGLKAFEAAKAKEIEEERKFWDSDPYGEF